MVANRTESAETCADGHALYRVRHDFSNECKSLRRLDRVVQIGALAVRQAIGERRARPILPEAGIIAGSARGPVSTIAAAYARSMRGVLPYPTQVAGSSPASLAASLAEIAGVSGAAFVVSSACTSGATAIATAAEFISAGHAMMIAGGSDAPLDPNVIAQFKSARALGCDNSPGKVLRPFDRERSGTALGEGAGFVVLEAMPLRADEAIGLAGWGINYAAGERQKPLEDGNGLATAIRRAFTRAQTAHEAISAIVLHANGTIAGDGTEYRALKSIFGERLMNVPCTAVKPVTGHCFGGSSAIEAIVGIEILRRQAIPPVSNCDDPEWPDIQIVRGEVLPGAYKNVLVVSSGFWGNHTALIFSVG